MKILNGENWWNKINIELLYKLLKEVNYLKIKNIFNFNYHLNYYKILNNLNI